MPADAGPEQPSVVMPGGPGTWNGRPPGMPGTVPPPSVPLSFLAAASIGLVACGGAWIWARGAAARDPTADPVVAATHLGMLATLSMGVLGALHQFTPVVSQRPLRSLGLARVTFLTWLAASWLLPLGMATEHEGIVEVGGALAAVSLTLLAVNLAKPLAARNKGAPLTGLRFALAGFIATAAHAVVGLFGWLGLTYVSVAEKLWPMFFLAHVPGRRRAGHVAVWAIPVGVGLVSPGLLLGSPALGALGAGVLVAGLAAHMTSLVTHVRHRRRPTDLHLLFVTTSALWLLVGAALALAALLVLPGHQHAGSALVAGAVAAFGGWLLETMVGHAHKVVPFIAWSALRSRSVDKNPVGKPLLFADLYRHAWAAVTYGLVTTGTCALCVGLSASLPTSTGVGGGLLVATGLVLATNLSATPIRMLSTGAAPARAGGTRWSWRST
jgi:hypothetical protein